MSMVFSEGEGGGSPYRGTGGVPQTLLILQVGRGGESLSNAGSYFGDELSRNLWSLDTHAPPPTCASP
jgi:hypothetical protein